MRALPPSIVSDHNPMQRRRRKLLSSSVQFPKDVSQLVQVRVFDSNLNDEKNDVDDTATESIWYTNEEFEHMRNQDRQVLESLTSCCGDDDDVEEIIIEDDEVLVVGDECKCNGDEEEEEKLLWCARGLVSNEEAWYSIELKREAILAVLTEQERQWDEADENDDREDETKNSEVGYQYDDELIADAYIEWTIENQEEAEERGWLDYCEIESYVEKDRQQIEELLLQLEKQLQQQEQQMKENEQQQQQQQEEEEKLQQELKEEEVQKQQQQPEEGDVRQSSPDSQQTPPSEMDATEETQEQPSLSRRDLFRQVGRGMSSPDLLLPPRDVAPPSTTTTTSRRFNERMEKLQPLRQQSMRHLKTKRQASMRNLMMTTTSMQRQTSLRNLTPTTRRHASMRNLMMTTKQQQKHTSLRHLNNKNDDHDQEDNTKQASSLSLNLSKEEDGGSIGVVKIDTIAARRQFFALGSPTLLPTTNEDYHDDEDHDEANDEDEYEQLVTTIKESSLSHLIKNNERTSSRVVRRPGHLARHLSCPRIIQ